MFFFRRIPDDFKSMMVVKYSFAVLLSHLVSALVVRLAVDKHVPIIVEDTMLTVNYSDFLA